VIKDLIALIIISIFYGALKEILGFETTVLIILITLVWIEIKKEYKIKKK
jgi:Na+/H+ antiporter NhaA